MESATMDRPDIAAQSSVPAAPSPARQIVLHADDLGMSAAVSDGILQGFERGLLTSTSLLSNAPDAERALEAWRELESRRLRGDLPSAPRRARLDDPTQPFDLGIHLNLTQGRPMTGSQFPAELLDADGRFPGIFSLFRHVQKNGTTLAGAIEEELTRQIEFMIEHGHRPTHLNGHQYIEMLPVVDRIVVSLLDKYRIPVVRVAWEPTWRRSFTWPGISTTQWLIGGVKKYYATRFRRRISGRKVRFADAFFGTMTAATTSLATIRAFLGATRGTHLAEIGLHPALEPQEAASRDAGWHDPLAQHRPRELVMVVSAELDQELRAHDCRLGRLARADAEQVTP
jgi:predicted glycoside hydrolase/deacetylase ChbG (UPF0249 family)